MEEKPKKARNFRNYKVWQDAVAYATKVYNVTTEMPWFEKKSRCDQLQRAPMWLKLGNKNSRSCERRPAVSKEVVG